MDLNVWLILTLICTASGTTPWRTGPPDKTDNSLSTIPETTADQTELVPFTAIVTDDTTPYSKVTTPSYGTEAHTSPQTTDNSLSTIPETTADLTELVTDKDDTTPYSKVTTPSYGTGAHTSPHTPVTTPSYLTELDTSTYTHTSVVTDSDDTTPYSKVTTPSYGTEAPISPQTPVTTPSYGTDAPISPQTPAWPPLTTQQPAQDENVTLVIGETQTIMSPNYPSNYPNNALYNWYITATSGYDVLIHFQNFYLQSNYDYLRIGTGDSATSPGSVEVVSLSGSSLPSDIRLFMLYKPTCWMKFTSNSLYTYQGFQLQLSIINSTSDEMLSLNFGDTKNTSSPNYPLNYDDNTEYTWYIAAPPGYDILVHFLDFYLESSYDYLLIWSGDSAASPGSIRLYTLTGSSLPSDRRINGPTGWMTLTSDSSVTYRGFELQLTLINSTVGGYCEECCECGDFIGCHCDSACQSRDDCCFDYTPHCSQVRLASMNIRYDGYVSGRVEVFTSESWGTVCNHNWDLKDGHVVCRSMGFQRASSVSYDLNFGPGTGDIHLDNVTCTGRESSILNCSHNGLGVHDCTHADDAGVQCSTNSAGYCQGCCDCGFIESGTCFCDVSCQELNDCCLDYESFCSEVNLRNGSNYIEGRVEVFADGIWGTVCDDFWDINDAKVVCKSMGFPGVEGAFSGAAFGEGTGNITLDNVNCTGEESSIFSCPSNGLGDHDCSHADDAGVRCSLSNDENVALISGETQTLNTPNYPDNYYDNTVYNWLITAPSGFHVLIRFSYMNLPICGDLVTIGTGESPTSSDSVQLASLSGYRNPSDIRLYTPNGWIQFTSDDYVYVINSRFELELSSVDSTAAPARLVNGSYPNEGRVEVYSNSLETWGTICDYGWDTMDATVICRGLDYPDAVSSYGSALFGMGSGPILLNDVDCDGDEDNIFYCPYESGDIDYCTHFEDAGAMCYPNVRLVNGSSPSEGRVEVYHDGIWGTVCDYLWDSPESRVVCRSLGFPDELASFPNAYFGEGIVPSLLRVQYCKGDENNIFDCCHYGIPYGCGHEDDVSVRCQPNVRLVDGGSSNEGRVELYHGDTWGTVCDNGWGMDEARVICRSLGYPDVLQAFGNASFGQGTGDILLDEVDCIGNESSIFYCYHNGVGVATCSHQDDAGVRCSTGVTTPSYLTEFDTSTYTQTSELVTDSDDTTPYSKVTTPYYGTDAPISPQTPAWPPLTTQQPAQDENVTLVIGEMQTIISPNYPSNYPNDALYNWYITAISGYDVLFHFLNFYLQSNYDYLRIGTGDSANSPESVEVVSLSGYSTPSDIRLFMLYTPTCWMQFTSNSLYTYQGFQLQLSIINSTSDEMLSLNIGDNKTISSPNYPLNYDDNTEYNWYIAAPPGYDILVHFLDFNTQAYYDYLMIGSGDSAASPGSIKLYSLAGSLPSDRRIYGPTGWMTFTSSTGTNYRGFELQLTLINSTLGGYCEECCECGDVIGCQCDSACQSRDDCCYDYSQHCSQVRLSGSRVTSGRVEVFANGSWGTVCDHNWDLKDGQVVCTSLGFLGVSSVYDPVPGTGDIHLDNVNCYGRESSIFNCSHNGIGVHDCTHADDAGVYCRTYAASGYCQGRCDYGFIDVGMCFCDVSCQEFDDCCSDYVLFCSEVHLRNGSNYIEGRVEVFADGVWGTVCDDFWDINDAKVVCKSMGFPGVEGAFSGAAFGEGTGNITLDNVNCTGEESRILYCPNNGLGVHDCSHADDAGVRCSLSNEENVSLTFGETLSLSSPNYPYRYYDNVVCNWLITAPSGYHVLIRFISMNLQSCHDLVRIGTGDSPTSSDSVQLVTLSGHDEPPDIRLYTPTGWIQFTSDESTITSGFRLELSGVDSTAAPARLVNGSYPNEGRVEVYSNSLDTWGTICDNGWDTMDATVICRSMDYPDAVRSYGSAFYGMGSGPILLNNVDCNGDEDNVFYCAYESVYIDSCTHSKDAGAICYPNVRLVNGSSPSEGRVEVYYDGVWGTVCDNNWDIPESHIICRSLGFPDALEYLPNAYFGEGTVDLLLIVLYCNGDESSIFDCCHNGVGYNYCGHDEDVGVRCQPNVRLVNGGSSNEGRVEVYHGDTWGTVCDNEWGMDEARVICKSLGYPDALQAYGNASFGQGTGDILLDEVVCIGNESSIFYCYHGGVGVTSCSHQDDAGVRCSTGVTTPSYLTEFDTSTYTHTSEQSSATQAEYTTPKEWPPGTTIPPRKGENVTLVIGETQNITSPNYPSNYTNDAYYNWYITAPPGYYVLIHFLDFNTESCCDYLQIGTGDSPTSYNSVQLASLSGSSLPSDIRLMTPTSWMKFTSNSNITEKGFQLEMSVYEAIEDETTAWTSITSLFYTVTSDPETTRDLEDMTTASTTTNIPTTSESSIPLPIIGAVTIVSLLVIVIIIVICVCLVCRKRRQRHMEEGLLDDDVFQPDYIELSPTPKTKKKNVIHKNRVSRPVLLANIETHYDWLKADSEHRLMEEYDDIQAVGSIVRMDQATNAEVNKTKNRFNKILPYEHSRVKLMALKGKSETDYINANYIPGFNSPREYIACQGPLPETTNDMWRMIWEKKSTIIVMMTKTVEGGKDKCHQYWPKKKGRSDTYGGSLEVSLQSELDYEHWITRTFMLQKNKMKREVIQLQFTSWPDHGVPEQTKPMLDFVKNVRERIRNKCVIKPVIVHCSAGVGRTGTYIALDRLTQHMEDNDFVDVCGVVCEMRMHRNYLVQTETQYIFIHDCLMDYFCSGVTP